MLHVSVPAVVRNVTDDIDPPQAREAIATIELLKVHAHCSKCGCAVVAKGGQRNSATLVFMRLACPGCAPNIRSEVVREEMTGSPRREFSSGKKRDILKARLMAENPCCSCCGKQVRCNAGNAPDGASLVIDRLSCRVCITTVRATAREEKLQQRKRKFPQSGLFSVKEWGEILGCGSVKLHAAMKRLHIPVEKGKVNASTWWAIVERNSREKGGQR